VDGHIVGVTFDSDLEASASEDGGNSSQGGVSIVQQFSLATRLQTIADLEDLAQIRTSLMQRATELK
jgi:hypothetical protein